eukprot:615662-Karenia_brevis.AAC.1
MSHCTRAPLEGTSFDPTYDISEFSSLMDLRHQIQKQHAKVMGHDIEVSEFSDCVSTCFDEAKKSLEGAKSFVQNFAKANKGADKPTEEIEHTPQPVRKKNENELSTEPESKKKHFAGESSTPASSESLVAPDDKDLWNQ